MQLNVRYNFLPAAGSSLGYQHTEETKAKIGAAQQGENNPMYGRTRLPPANATIIYIYTLDGELAQSFLHMLQQLNRLVSLGKRLLTRLNDALL